MRKCYYPYADGQDIKVLSGQVKLSGAMLANPAGQPDDLLIAAGQVVVTGEVTTVGYRQVIVAGQLAAPAASRDVIEPRIQAQGQVAWYLGENPRVFNDDITLGRDFFRLLDRPASLVVFGDLTIAAGVTETMVQEKITSLVTFGDWVVPPELVGVLQVLATVKIHAYFTGRTGDRESAADLMQDVFLRVWQHLEELTDMPDDRQRAWIFTVARNLSVDVRRHLRIQAGAMEALVHEPARAPRSASATVIAAERAAIVGEAIRLLPEQQRVTLTMAAASGLTSSEIGAALGVPAGTVRYRLSLARRALSLVLDRYDYPAEK